MFAELQWSNGQVFERLQKGCSFIMFFVETL